MLSFKQGRPSSKSQLCISPYLRTCLKVYEQFSRNDFLVIYYKFATSLYFRKIFTFSISEKNLHSPYFRQIYHLPLFSHNLPFSLLLRFFLESPILTMMYLCIVLYTYGTPLLSRISSHVI